MHLTDVAFISQGDIIDANYAKESAKSRMMEAVPKCSHKRAWSEV